MGWNVAVLRRVSVLQASGGERQSLRVLRMAAGDTAVLGLVVAALVVLATGLLNSDRVIDVSLAALVGILWAEIGILVSYLRAKGDLIWSQLGDGVIIYVVPLGICGAMAAANAAFEFGLIMATYAASALLAISCLLVVMVRRRSLSAEDPNDPFDARSERQLAHRLWWNQAFSALSGRASVLLAAPVAGVAATAIVEAGLRTQLVGATLAWAGGTVASPRYAVAHESNNAKGAHMLNVVTWAALLPSLAVVAALIVWGEPILSILGPAFVAERWAITLMALAAVFELPASSGGYFMMMTGRERLASMATIVQLLTLVVFILTLGSIWGSLGIAIGVLATAALRSALVLVGLRRDGVRSPLSMGGLNTLMGSFLRRLRFGS